MNDSQTLPPGSSKRRRPKFSSAVLGYILIAPPLLLMALLIFFPVVQSVGRTLIVEVDGDQTLSLANYIAFFENPISVTNLVYTVWITLVTVAVLFFLCFPLSLYLRFSNSRIADWVQGLALFPLFVPGIILAYALIRFMGTHGTLESLLNVGGITNYRSPYLKPDGIVIGLVWEMIPLTVLILTAGLRQLDNALLESARDVGASHWQIFRRIILPLLQRPVLIVLSLNFLGIFGSFTIPYLLGPAAPEMMGVYMQRTFIEVRQPREAETQAVVAFLVTAAVGLLYVRTVVSQRIQERG